MRLGGANGRRRRAIGNFDGAMTESCVASAKGETIYVTSTSHSVSW